MKKIFLSTLLIAFMAAPALAFDGGAKKKAKKNSKQECKMDKCDPKNCDPTRCDYKACPKEAKCTPTTGCSGS